MVAVYAHTGRMYAALGIAEDMYAAIDIAEKHVLTITLYEHVCDDRVAG
jgi:hypothetical protein